MEKSTKCSPGTFPQRLTPMGSRIDLKKLKRECRKNQHDVQDRGVWEGEQIRWRRAEGERISHLSSNLDSQDKNKQR